MEQSKANKAKKAQKVIVIISGIAFLGSSIAGVGGLIASSLREPPAKENPTQSQNAQLDAQEKGFLGVLQREPKNPTAISGLGSIINMRMQQGDVPGTRATLAKLVKIDPTNLKYKEFLAAIDKQIADTKKVGTLKPTEPTQPTKSSK
jgi:hypothetical protein